MASVGAKARNDEIWKKWKNGATIAELSRLYGMDSNNISSLISYREEKYNSPEYHKKLMKLYVKEKIKVLKQLGVKVTDDHKDHLYSLPTELEVDNYAHKLFMDC